MSTAADQLSFDGLGTPLREVTFVVVDLETTGGAPATDAITRSVRLRGSPAEEAGRFGYPGAD